MKEYRTYEQFLEIMSSIENGNWSQGAKECEEYGFYANDLVEALKSSDIYDYNDPETLENLVFLIELATKLR